MMTVRPVKSKKSTPKETGDEEHVTDIIMMKTGGEEIITIDRMESRTVAEMQARLVAADKAAGFIAGSDALPSPKPSTSRRRSLTDQHRGELNKFVATSEKKSSDQLPRCRQRCLSRFLK